MFLGSWVFLIQMFLEVRGNYGIFYFAPRFAQIENM